MTNKEIARALSETAALIELTGGNAFRARALASAARTVKGLEDSAQARLDAGTLTDIDGIGDGLSSQIGELLSRGSFELRDDLMNAVPPGLPTLLRVKGLGTKKVRRLWKELDITSLDELEEAASSGAVASLDGFGKKTQSNILKNVELQRQYEVRRRINEAYDLAQREIAQLKEVFGFTRIELAGELRRNLETVDRIELVVKKPADIGQLNEYQAVDSTLPVNLNTTTFQRTIEGTFPIRLTLADPAAFGTVLWYLTGAESHLNDFTDQFGAPATFAEEDELFASAGIPPIPPEIREGTGEFQAALNNELPELITVDHLEGTLHNHSTYSDGTHTLRTMAEHARTMGLSYFGICDHSQSLTVASGLSLDEVVQQQEEIRQLNKEYAQSNTPFKIFSGIESDILADGSLDYPKDVLASFDFVVGSIHSRFNMSRAEATERLITAIQHPATSILGHTTGRLLLVREGYDVDHERIIQACAQHNVAIELNANPYRLDMDWRFIKRATENGVLISINPDAHATAELAYVRWGVAVARKGWLTADQCLNALPLSEFENWIANQGSTS